MRDVAADAVTDNSTHWLDSGNICICATRSPAQIFDRVFRQTSHSHIPLCGYLLLSNANAFFLRVPPHTTGTNRSYGSKEPGIVSSGFGMLQNLSQPYNELFRRLRNIL